MHARRRGPLASVAIVVLVGLAMGFGIIFPVLGLADHYGASDPVMLTLFIATTAGVPSVVALQFIRKWGRRAKPVLQLVLAFAAALLVYFALAPIACDDSIRPRCTTFLGLESTNDDPIEGVIFGVAAGATAWLALWPLMRVRSTASAAR